MANISDGNCRSASTGEQNFLFYTPQVQKKRHWRGFSFSFASVYVLTKCKPEIVLDGACDGLNFPLGVVQLHVSARLGVCWTTQHQEVLKKDDEEKFYPLELICVILCVYPSPGSGASALWS